MPLTYVPEALRQMSDIMRPTLYRLYNRFRGSFLHPQWLSDRFHIQSRVMLRKFEHSIILDVGSGNSDNSKFISQSNSIYRLDYPETNKSYACVPDVYGDASSLPIAANSVDVILLFEVLEHIPDHEKTIQEITRVLKPKGMLCISVPFIYPIHDAPHDYRRFTIYGLRALLNKHRLSAKKEIQYGNAFVVALQLMNLAILEFSRKLWKKQPFLGILFSPFAYLMCLLNNVVAWPLTFLPRNSASCFGYFVIAERG